MGEDEDSGKLGILGNGGDALLTAIADGNAGFTAYRAAEKPEAGTRNWRRRIADRNRRRECWFYGLPSCRETRGGNEELETTHC